MKTLCRLVLVFVLISFGFAFSASGFQEFVQLSSDMHSEVYIPNIVADSRTAGAETRLSVYTVKPDYINRFPFGDPGFHEIPDYSVAGYKTTSVETRPSVYTVKLDNMNSFPLGDPDLGFWTDADFTVADSRTAGALSSNYLGESLALRTDIADHRVSSVVDYSTASAEYYIPNIQGP